MGTRIGAALMIVVAVFLMTGFETSGVFGMPGITVEYTVASADGSLIPVSLD